MTHAPRSVPTPTSRPQPKIGIQVGHWRCAELPDELARIRSKTGAMAGTMREVDINARSRNGWRDCWRHRASSWICCRRAYRRVTRQTHSWRPMLTERPARPHAPSRMLRRGARRAPHTRRMTRSSLRLSPRPTYPAAIRCPWEEADAARSPARHSTASPSDPGAEMRSITQSNPTTSWKQPAAS